MGNLISAERDRINRLVEDIDILQADATEFTNCLLRIEERGKNVIAKADGLKTSTEQNIQKTKEEIQLKIKQLEEKIVQAGKNFASAQAGGFLKNLF